MDRWMRQGIEAYRAGKRAQAQRFFRFALMKKPDDLRLWLWMVEVAETDAEKLHCLEQVLALDPENRAARRAWQGLQSRDQAADLPHVSPFLADETETPTAEPPAPPTSAARSSFPPTSSETPPDLPPERRFPWFWMIGVALGLLLLLALVWLWVRPF